MATLHFRFLIVAFLAFLGCEAQKIAHRDPQIEEMVSQVSREELEKISMALDSFVTRNTMSNQTSADFGVGAARRWIHTTMSDNIATSPDLPGGGKALTVEFDPFFDNNLQVEIVNVIGTLQGTGVGPAACSIIISGHYDTRPSDRYDPINYAPGADDDGSGTAIVIETLRVMHQYQYQCTIYFVAFCAEEQGLIGATHLAQIFQDRDEPLYAMLNNDIVGGSSPSSQTGNFDNSRVRVFSRAGSGQQGESDGPSRAVARAMKEVGERYVDYLEPVLIYRNDRYNRGGDHRVFGDRGWGVVRVTEMNENFQRQHQDVRIVNGTQYGDLPEFLDFIFEEKVAGINLATAAVLAKAPRPPTNPQLLAGGLDNTSTIRWSHPPGVTPAGYYLLIRATTSPFWEKKIFTAYPATEITTVLSKDNWFFGVQSVDEFGNESLGIFVSS